MHLSVALTLFRLVGGTCVGRKWKVVSGDKKAWDIIQASTQIHCGIV